MAFKITCKVLVNCWLVMVMTSVQPGGSDNEVKHIYVNAGPDQSFDVCEGQTFKPECPSGSVIVMREAIFGRMRAGGDCLDPRESANIGCTDDFLDTADVRCSGETTCEIKIEVHSDDFKNLNNCPVEQRKYLQVEYTCMEVFVPQVQQCSLPLTVSVDKPMAFANSVLAPSGCEVLNLQADPGQTLDLHLMDFTREKMSGIGYSRPQLCSGPKYAEIFDPVTDKETDVCQGSDRGRRLLSSEKNSLRLTLDGSALRAMLKFMITVSARGCKDITPPASTWVRRDREELVIGCQGNAHTWHLTCQNSRWEGVIGNCSDVAVPPLATPQSKDVTMTPALLMTLILSSAAVICTAVIVLGAYCIKKWSVLERRRLNTLQMEAHQFTTLLRQQQLQQPAEPTYAVYDRIPSQCEAATLPCNRPLPGCPLDPPLLPGFDKDGHLLA